MRCEPIVVRRSTNGEWRWFDRTVGSVFGSFFVVIAVTSASSLLISLKIPDDVLSDVVEPIRTSPQSAVVSVVVVVVVAVAAGAPPFSCWWCVGDVDLDLAPSFHCTENFNERFSKYRLSPANTFGIFDAHVNRVVVISILSSRFSSYSASTRTQRPCLSNTGSFALWLTFFRFRDRCERTFN